MKKLMISLLTLMTSLTTMAQVQGWPANYDGVMLQGFYWDSYNDSRWTVLASQADELAQYFKLVWIPQSGNCKGQSMGYDDYWWFPGNNNGTSYNSSFGTEQELRSMISTFKQKGIGTIADVVINHRKNRSTWVDFPKETYNGVEYRLQSTDICKYDDKYYNEDTKKWVYPTLDWATANGYELSSNRDTGEDWAGMRDLDHKSENVQTNVKAYLNMLLNDLGYIGFRYDMVKGYGAEYTKIYNEDSKPTYSVGECWDSSNTITTWINNTGKTSGAFDFQFKYVVRNAVDAGDWSVLGQGNGTNNYPLVYNEWNNGSYRQYAVTFVENHDTEVRPDGSSNGPLKADTLAANAYLMAMPGTPCVFMKHWVDCKQYIKPMIEARQLAGLKNTSGYEVLKSEKACYAVKTDDKLICIVGDASKYTPSGDFVKILDGYHYAYYLRKNVANRAWVSHESGHYMGEQQVVLSAITTQNARMAYTLDGKNPTASSASVASGEKVTIPVGTTTLKAAMLVNGAISGSIITRTYEVEYVEPFAIPDFCVVNDGETCAFFEAPATWNNINCYTWSGSTPFDGAWPGKACTQVGTYKNKKVWKWSYSGTKTTQPTNIIFNDGSSQTGDLAFKNGGYYNENGIRGTVTGIQVITTQSAGQPQRFYTLDGRYAGTDYSTLSRGIYIVNGKKVVR
jgi:alpha-amylase